MVEIKYIIYFVCAAGWKRSSQSSPRSLEEVRKRKCECLESLPRSIFRIVPRVKQSFHSNDKFSSSRKK
ncbi:uncharacterized protein LOC113464135 isoform X3 [Ceratina calcarata]|uniref:Uncharacterized protein LOC113464135 isoform X3 n=1 Tax=Ceratina calcarata TaxID=156304 RepID=A0AAJ7RZA0_9HYME|nr:uncharacterized protein LOC113464135 isoform X3 [Ceratina calcarata]